jgi:hypothetical protein
MLFSCGTGSQLRESLGGGGVLIGIKSKGFDVGRKAQGDFVLQHELWDKLLETKWNLLNVYGTAQREHKEEFLAELGSFLSKNSIPYIVGGDFNIIIFSSEKNKGSAICRFSSIFNNLI